MSDALRLTIAFDDSWSAELFVSVSVGGFAGRSSAWFDPQKLRDLAKQLSDAFPLTRHIGIQGGYLAPDSAAVVQEHVGLSFYPVAGQGVLGCQVRLSVDEPERAQARAMLQLELLTSYQALQDFAQALMQLADGLRHEAVLHAANP